MAQYDLMKWNLSEFEYCKLMGLLIQFRIHFLYIHHTVIIDHIV